MVRPGRDGVEGLETEGEPMRGEVLCAILTLK
jgi:hypothetical protein